MRKLLALALLALSTISAAAQPGPQPPPDPWTIIGNTINPPLGFKIVTSPSVTGSAPFNIPPGSAPSAPTNGDMWSSSSGIFARINGGTVGPFIGASIAVPMTIDLNSAALPAAQTGTLLQVGNANGTTTRIEADAFAAAAHFTGIRADGTAASPTTLQSGDSIASFNAWGYDGSAYIGPQAAIRCYAAQNWTPLALGTYCDVAVTANSATTLTESVRFENDGGVTLPSTVTGGDKGAGTINAAGLYVNGTAVLIGSTGVTTFSAGTTGFTPSSATSGAISLAGTLVVANGGTNCSSASITCLNNIIGTSYSGTTGGTNLVGSASPTLSGTVGGNLTLSGNIAFGGTITAASLSTPGTIAGSICATSAGVFLYNVGLNCFAATAASVTVGTTTVVGASNNYFLYNNNGSLGDAALTTFLTAGNGIAITGTTNATIAVSLSEATNSLGSDVNMNNTSNYFDGPSTNCGSACTTGTWFASGQATVFDTAGAATVYCKLWDGTTVIDSAGVNTTGANAPEDAHLSGYLASPAANIKISCRDTSSTSGVIKFNTTGNSKDSTISVHRIN
jgi:hypothetical protein